MNSSSRNAKSLIAPSFRLNLEIVVDMVVLIPFWISIEIRWIRTLDVSQWLSLGRARLQLTSIILRTLNNSRICATAFFVLSCIS
jgi:hypothetical protein